MKNNGVFTILTLRNELDEFKNVIVYIENGVERYLEKYTFDSYPVADNYLKNNKEELDNYVTQLKEEEKAERERLEQEEKEKEEEEKRKKEEKEAKKAAKKAEKKAKKAEKETKKAAKKEEKQKKKEKNKGKTKERIIASILTVITLAGGHFVAKGISSTINKEEDVKPTEPEVTKPESTLVTTTPEETVLVQEEILTGEKFEDLVISFSKPYVDNNINVTTEDLIKFVSIVNIDLLSEQNPELAKELFREQSREEYLGDAAKIIGMTYTYNKNVFEKEGKTDNFIRISDSVYGPQKEKMLIIESYVDQIALVRNDSDEANRLITELIVRLGDPQSDLSYLDDGVGFGMQVNIELIRSYLAKDVISKENFDMLTVLTSSEEYVSNIFTTYSGCLNIKTKTK